MVLPSLLLSYFGQGALMMTAGAQQPANAFFALVPRVLLYPCVVVAAGAGIIASQALISGAFSLTQQRCSSATSRASPSSTPPATPGDRSTSPRSTGR